MGEHPQSFIFEKEGDSITGTVVRYAEAESKFGTAPIVVLNTEEGERSVWLFGSVLKERIGKLRPEVGERVEITFEEKRTSAATGNDYKLFTVEVPDHPPAEYKPPFADWAADSTNPDLPSKSDDPGSWG